MASYEVLEPDKNGNPRVKITVDFGYDENGRRLRKRKNVTLSKLTETNIINAISQFEKSLGAESQSFSKPRKASFQAFAESFMQDYVNVELKVKTRNGYENYLKKGILDFFGHMLLHKITHTQINMFFCPAEEGESREHL